MLDKKFFTIGADVVARFREHTFEKALDVFGNKFKGYSDKYGKLKRANKLKRQFSKYKNSTAPVVSTDLLRDWKLIKVSESGFEFGTVKHGFKIEHLAKKGRVISTSEKPIPDNVILFLDREMEKYGDKKLSKNKGRTFKIG